MTSLPAIVRVEVDVDDLRPGDRVELDRGTPRETTSAVVRIEARYNPAFRPVVLDVDPHYAIDLDRDSVVAVWRVAPAPPFTCKKGTTSCVAPGWLHVACDVAR